MKTAQSQVDSICDAGPWDLTWARIRECVDIEVTRASGLHGICPFDLKLRALLHLPRYQAADLSDRHVLHEEINRLAKKAAFLQSHFSDWSSQTRIGTFEKHSVHVVESPQEMADVIHGNFHYIGSCRTGRHFSIYFDGIDFPAALATVSMMDVHKLKKHLPCSEIQNNVLLSRVFAFRWAPRNTMSYLLGSIARRLKQEARFTSISTWLNPNLGFDASSYRAANWKYVGNEPTTYRYFDGNYLTARDAFRRRSESRAFDFEVAQYALAPLEIWQYRIGP